MLHAVLSLLAILAVPVHGVVLGPGPAHTTIVRTDPVTGMVPAQTRAFTISPRMQLPPGTGVDAFLDRSSKPWRLYDAAVAAKFVPGLPDPGIGFPIDYGTTLPHTKLVDQNGRIVDLATDFRGKVTLVSFMFTRCPDKDECPLVSSKFAYLQQHLDPSRFHLVEISLDPVYDSPAVLRQYARQYGVNAQAWSMLTGQPHEIGRVLGRFGISSLRESDENFIHNDKVFVIAQDGKVADILQGVAFGPAALVAQARHMAGMASNPFGRLQLALVAGAVALCGGSQFAGVVLLETVVFLLIAAASFATLAWVARKIFWKNA
jgi:protein SCO1/2